MYSSTLILCVYIPLLLLFYSQYGIPSWLVALRHDGTHRMLPSLAALHSGVQFAVSWLKENYWEPQAELMMEGRGEEGGGGRGRGGEGGRRGGWGVKLIKQVDTSHVQATNEVSHLHLKVYINEYRSKVVMFLLIFVQVCKGVWPPYIWLANVAIPICTLVLATRVQVHGYRNIQTVPHLTFAL